MKYNINQIGLSFFQPFERFEQPNVSSADLAKFETIEKDSGFINKVLLVIFFKDGLMSDKPCKIIKRIERSTQYMLLKGNECNA